MVYAKYIKRNGKTFGPYFYENKKVNGKVVTKYLGSDLRKIRKEQRGQKKFGSKFFVFGGVFLFLILGLFFVTLPFTGNITLDILPSRDISSGIPIGVQLAECDYHFRSWCSFVAKDIPDSGLEEPYPDRQDQE